MSLRMAPRWKLLLGCFNPTLTIFWMPFLCLIPQWRGNIFCRVMSHAFRMYQITGKDACCQWSLLFYATTVLLKKYFSWKPFMFASFTWNDQSYLSISTNPYLALKSRDSHQEWLWAGQQLGQRDWRREVLEHVLELKSILILQINEVFAESKTHLWVLLAQCWSTTQNYSL